MLRSASENHSFGMANCCPPGADQQARKLVRGTCGPLPAIWRLDSQSTVTDWKRNAGAAYNVERERVAMRRTTPPRVESNVFPLCLDLNKLRLYFLIRFCTGSTAHLLRLNMAICKSRAYRHHSLWSRCRHRTRKKWVVLGDTSVKMEALIAASIKTGNSQ